MCVCVCGDGGDYTQIKAAEAEFIQMEGHTLALKVIEVVFCSSEDASVTLNMWRNSCAVTRKLTPPPPSQAHH